MDSRDKLDSPIRKLGTSDIAIHSLDTLDIPNRSLGTSDIPIQSLGQWKILA